MTSIVLDNVTVDFPIYGSSRRSLRQTIFARTGGLIRDENERRHHVVVRALENVSFKIEHGDRVGLVGHNGAGKTTLLKVLAGVYKPESGTINVEGSISPLFNSAPGLDSEDTGYENIITCGMFLGMSRMEINHKLPDIEEFCELGDYLSLPVRTYSAGMTTRLGFAIATALDPDILLLDEGLAAGDARFATRAERRMKALIDRSSILVLASHSEGMIAAMCNKTVLMETGRVIAIGPTREIIELYHQKNAGTEAGWTSPPGTTAEPQASATAPPQGAAEPTDVRPDQNPSDGTQIQLVYQAIHTVSEVLPSNPERITPWGGSSILGYSYDRKGSETALKVHIQANAYAIDDNEVVIAVFRAGQSIPLKYEVERVAAGGHALFDFVLDVPMDNVNSANLDVRIGPAEPGSLTINGPEGGPPPGIPSPALTITPVGL